MERLCTKTHLFEIDKNNIKICMKGCVYDIEKFEGGQALVGGTWFPDYIFSDKTIIELYGLAID